MCHCSGRFATTHKCGKWDVCSIVLGWRWYKRPWVTLVKFLLCSSLAERDFLNKADICLCDWIRYVPKPLLYGIYEKAFKGRRRMTCRDSSTLAYTESYTTHLQLRTSDKANKPKSWTSWPHHWDIWYTLLSDGFKKGLVGDRLLLILSLVSGVRDWPYLKQDNPIIYCHPAAIF